jgi:hypothetical protein
MNRSQRSRLDRLEQTADTSGVELAQQEVAEGEDHSRQTVAFYAGQGPYPPELPCPSGEDPDMQARIRRSLRIRARRQLELFGRNERAAAIPIDPPPTEDEIRRADEFVNAILHASLRNRYEEERTERPYHEWLANQQIPSFPKNTSGECEI